MVHQHPDRSLSISYGPYRLGRYSAEGEIILATPAVAYEEKPKPRNRTFHVLQKADIFTC
jgi:hypothetical protein